MSLRKDAASYRLPRPLLAAGGSLKPPTGVLQTHFTGWVWGRIIYLLTHSPTPCNQRQSQHALHLGVIGHESVEEGVVLLSAGGAARLGLLCTQDAPQPLCLLPPAHKAEQGPAASQPGQSRSLRFIRHGWQCKTQCKGYGSGPHHPKVKGTRMPGCMPPWWQCSEYSCGFKAELSKWAECCGTACSRTTSLRADPSPERGLTSSRHARRFG